MANIDQVIKGLQIIEKYASEGRVADVMAMHDILLCGPSIAVEEISEDDKQLMYELGWHINSEFDCWARFT